ncbi:uncharacterized protein [Typha latifolia]|uniref:uncharacterized protein n=1 Tax=Typha latifolia TaxID=4733 RepID=UPI003C2D8FE8
MGRRSDFAQKLLDDLRLRKEKLGFATSQSQRSTTTTTAVAVSGDSYGNSRRFLGRSGEATSSSLSGKSMVKKDRQLGLVVKHHRAAGPEGLSQDLVPFKRGTNLGDTVDMPMALALALSYSGKLQNIEVFSKAKVGNEFIMHRGSISFSDRNSRYPFAPHLQVSEISRGVQKLNEILTACYSGTSIGRSSIEIGRELLRGAVDLEESLRMLIMLQEASDSMVGSQGSQVLLLKDKEEDDSSSKKAKQKKTHRTIFSFDGSYSDSRKTKAAATSNSSKSSPNASMQSISHRRSSSCGPGTKPDAQFSILTSTTRKYEEVGQFPDSSCNSAASSRTTEKFVQIGNPTNAKVRIPNVVARLMGLEELPPPKEEVKMAEVSKAAKSVRETKEARTVKLEDNKYLQAKDTRDIKAAKVVEVTREKASLASSTNSGSISLASKSSPKPHFSMEYSKKDEQSKKEFVQSSKTTETKEQRSQGKAGEIIHDVKQSTQANKARVTAKQYLRYHEDAIRKKDFLLKDQNRMAIARSQQKKSALAQEKISHTLQGSATGREQRERSRAELITGARSDPKLRNIGKSSNEVGRQKALSCTQAVAEKRRSAGRNANKDQLRRQSTINHTRSINSTYHEPDRKAETGILGDNNQSKTDTCQILVTVMNKPTHIPTLEEIDQTDITVHRTESNKKFQDSHKICEQSTPISHHLKEEDFILDQLEIRSEERTIKVEETSQILDSKHYDKVDNEAASISRATLPDACRRLTAETNNLGIISKASDIQQTPQVPLKNDEVELPNLTKEQSEGSLTEKQQLLMGVLLKDYQFLNTAQALFQVEIPLGILQASEKVCQSKDNKLLLDCGHELMRRKSKREGVALLLKRAGVRCLDALIRELNHEIESLDFPRKTQGDEYDTVERLHRMLEREIPNKNPDANCMWDFGWNSTTLAAVQIDEIVKEMEKYVLKGLIDELARDLMDFY